MAAESEQTHFHYRSSASSSMTAARRIHPSIAMCGKVETTWTSRCVWNRG